MVDQYLRQALIEKEKVSLPGFGVFKIETSSADLNEDQGVFLPPLKRVHFEPSIVHAEDEHSLVKFMADHAHVDPAEAEAAINEFISTVREDVRLDGGYNIPELGRFHVGMYGSIDFTVHDDAQLRPESFGLPVLTVSQLPAIPEPEPLATTVRKEDSRLWLVLIPLVLIAIALAFVFVNPTANQWLWSQVSNITSPAQEDPALADTTSAPQAADPAQDPKQGQDPVAAEVAPETTPKEDVKPQASPTQPNTTPQQTTTGGIAIVESRTDRWYLSVASFTDLNLAKNDVAAAVGKGYTEAKVVVGGPGRYRVSIADFPDKSAADAKASQAAADYKNIWVFKF